MLSKLSKILSLIIIILTLTGCNMSYNNLNDMAIVSSFLIDKKDDTYEVSIELYKEEKSENKSKKVSYFIDGTGKNLRDAITDASSSISKRLYFNHINAVIISEKAINNNLEYIFNYLEKRIQVNSNYYILVSDELEKLKKSKNEDNTILGEKIKNLIKNSTNNGAMFNYDYLEKLANFVGKNKDIFFNKLSVVDDNITIQNGYYFSGERIAGELSSDETKLMNLFQETKNLYFDFNYENDNYYVLKIDTSDYSFNFDNGIKITLDIKANIDSAGSDIDLTSNKVINKLSNHASSSIERRLRNFIDKLKTNKSDILAINNYIYKYCGYKKYDFFNEDVRLKVNLTINKKGLVNNTIGGKNEN